MRNKLTRRNRAGVGEIQSRVVTQSDLNLLLSPVASGSDTVSVLKDSAPMMEESVGLQVISNIYKPQPEESHASKLGACVMRETRHARSEPVCKTHRYQDRLYGLLTKPVSLRGESFQSFQSKRSSPKHCLNQRYAITPACTSEYDSSPYNCLEEIKKSNPTFPARRVFRGLQKKSSENKCNLISPVEKRKRQHELNVPGKDSKRQRKAVLVETTTRRPSESCVLSTEAVQVHSRLSRTQRLKRLRQGAGLCDTPQPTPKSETEAISYGPNTAGISDVLWTEKYSPLHSSEVIGNSSSVNKVHSWLKKWRLRVDGYDQKEEAERKRPHDDDGLWDCGAFQGDAGSEGKTLEQLSTTLLITGPPGSGKTASVYACALELGFKVFEVNCSSQRSGRCVLAQLKEVTQSHLVEAPGKEALRPAYYNNYNLLNSRGKPDALPGPISSKATVSTSKLRPGPHQGHSRRRRFPDPGVAPLTSFFKTTAEDPAVVASPPPEDHQEPSRLATRSAGAGRRDPRSAAISLVLFEEVDVIFDDDLGFLSAIKTLMTTTKRPVVLTTSDPLFKERFESDVEEILFITPSAVNVCSYLRLVCLAENARTWQHEVAGLLAECHGDLRRCLLQLHFLVKSSMGRRPRRTGSPRQSVLGGSDRTKDGEERVKCVPLPADAAGYSASCLNTLTKRNILHLLKCQSWAEPENELLTVLTESWRRHFPLLYSNLELLLPLPASTQGTTNRCQDKDPKAGTITEPPAPAIASQPRVKQQGQPGENIDLKAASSSTMRTCLRNTSRLSRRKGILTPTDCSRSSNSALQPPQKEGQRSLEGTHLAPQGSVDKTGDKGIRASTHRGLEALAHFVDLMSYLDSTMENVESHVSGPCVPKDFFWTGAEVKDGLVDEMREGGGERTWRQLERMSEIQAAVEGLGFHVYQGRVSAASSGAPTWRQEVGGVEAEEPVDRLSLPGSTLRQSSGGHLPPKHRCVISTAQWRFELSRAVLQNQGFSLLGSRRAVCLDYMSTLRSICHHQLQKHGRFQNYLRSIHLGLSNTTMQQLAEECME
ncbi:ATPase family AAA domain-containing protein 5b isoform X1 [Gadus chalcogrammus]|uniref:ATPase family AAA domain-containing protein 5b isoform X1 n=1 Tax=Gadus chalcogrammus TaxID=1042646 RepID=UPI0024C3197E|nr:ATPase family AAA domain-containing protein 5b isoform X1 [Gadus chalcogrammus]